MINLLANQRGDWPGCDMELMTSSLECGFMADLANEEFFYLLPYETAE